MNNQIVVSYEICNIVKWLYYQDRKGIEVTTLLHAINSLVKDTTKSSILFNDMIEKGYIYYFRDGKVRAMSNAINRLTHFNI